MSKNYHVGGEDGKGSFEQALENAAKEKGIALESLAVKPEIKSAPVTPVASPAIQVAFEMKPLSDEEMEASRKLAEETKKSAQALAKQELDIKEALRHYKEKNPKWEELSDVHPVRVEMQRLQNRLNELKGLDGYLGEKKDSAKVVEEIRRVARYQSAKAMMNRLVKMGLYSEPTPERIKSVRQNLGKRSDGTPKKWPDNTKFLAGRVFFAEGPQNSYTRAIHAEVLEMNKRVVVNEIALMKEEGNHDLAAAQDSKPGRYFAYAPARTDERGRKHTESHVLFSVYDRNKDEKGRQPYWVAEIEDAFGDLRRLLESDGRRFVPHFWLKAGKVITKAANRLESEDYGRAMGIIETLNAACRAYGEAQNVAKAAAEAKETKELVQKVDELLDKVLPGATAPAKIEPPTPPAETAAPIVEVPAPEAPKKAKGGKKAIASK